MTFTRTEYETISSMLYNFTTFDFETDNFRIIKDNFFLKLQSLNDLDYCNLVSVERNSQDMVHCILSFVVQLEKFVESDDVPF